MFDLYYFIFNRAADQSPADLPGLLVVPPSKPGGRGREGDLLIIHLTFNGPSPYLPPAERDLLKKLAATYAKSSGSVTSGLRLVAEQLNGILFERNLREARDGAQAFGLLSLAVLRDEMLFLAHAGPARSLVLKNIDVQENADTSPAQRGLGAASAVSLRFYQSMLQPGDVLLISANPPAGWDAATLAGSAQLTLEHLRRRLLAQSEAQTSELVFKFQSGKGQLHPLRLRPSAPPAAAEGAAQGAQPVPTPAAPPAAPAVELPAPTAPTPILAPVQRPAAPPRSVPPSQSPVEAERIARSREAEAEAAAARLAARRIEANQRRQKMATQYLGWKARREKWALGWKNFLAKILPVRANQPVGLSQGSMLFIAVVIPLLVVAVATTVYFQTGRTEQRQVYYQQAVAYVTQALAQTDPILQRNDWVQVLQWLDKTETYGVTDETRTLRRRAQQGVDGMDKIVRLDFTPVNNYAFTTAAKITRVLAASSDLYALDATTGRVTHLMLGAQGYDLDANFNCGPGASGALNINPLVDIALMPLGNPQRASLIGLDNKGTIIYCIQGKSPVSAQLTPPTTGWGAPTRIHFSSYTLSVLDAKANTVWRYAASKDMLFEDAPRSFFKDSHTLSITDVVDMAVYNDDLFLLRGDGRVVKCSDSRLSNVPVRCTDPAKFEDRRPGRETSPTRINDAVFTQLIAVEMPNPSLYMLDTSSPAIYQFSMALYLNEQYRAQPYGETGLPAQAPTAFAISTNRQVFIAFGSRLVYAQIR